MRSPQGGPYGSNWNADALRCVVQLDTACDVGQPRVVLWVGKLPKAERALALQQQERSAQRLVTPANWRVRWMQK